MKLESMRFEGTPEEFKAVAHLFEDPTSKEEGKKLEEVTEMEKKDAIRTMITRRKLPNGQRELYLALMDGPLEYDELLAKTSRSPEQMRGLIGALGKRVNATGEVHEAGLVGDSTLVLNTYLESGKKYIGLTDEVLEVLKEPEVYKLLPYD